MAAVDPLGNAFTKIRNASRARHATVEVPASHMTQRILEVLKQEGFIRAYKPSGQAPHQRLRVYLKYLPDRTPAITQLVQISKPGRRMYRRSDDLPRVLSGLGKAVLTTSNGLMTNQQARRQKIGGEVLCYVW